MTALRLSFTGDVCLGGRLRELMARHGPAFPVETALRALTGADPLVGNLECCLTSDPGHLGRRFTAVPVSSAGGLKTAGFDAMSLANNHTMDLGPEGLVSTLSALNRLDIQGFGAGRDLVQAERAVVLERKGRRLALLGASGFSQGDAGVARAGTAPLDPSRLGDRVRAVRRTADLVVVNLHADLEFSPYPSTWRVRLSRWLVDQGADVVVQHHPHVCQGVERYRQGLIAYSLGNFVFQVEGNAYLEGHAGTRNAMLWSVGVDFSGSAPRLSWDWVPMEIGVDHRPHPCRSNDTAARREDLALRSSRLGDAGLVRREWAIRCRAEARLFVSHLYYSARRGQWDRVRGAVRGLFVNREDRRWIRGLLTAGRV
jgi:poly-gamma-glutamate synthesis protein (capsule biosynthesis protein)